MRADAVRRRETLLREARRLFAAHGGNVALESIAEASGVGIATLYRNFESRDALAEEVALAILADIRDVSDSALAAMPETPDAAWRGYIGALVELDLGASRRACRASRREGWWTECARRRPRPSAESRRSSRRPASAAC